MDTDVRRVWTSSASGHEEARGSRGKGTMKGKSKGRNRGYPLHQLSPGAEVKGEITSIAAFGVFVNIGAEKDGLLPWSKCTLHEDVEVGQALENLRVDSVDLARQRFSLEGPFEEMTWTSWNPEALNQEDAEYEGYSDPWAQPQKESWHKGWQDNRQDWQWQDNRPTQEEAWDWYPADTQGANGPAPEVEPEVPHFRSDTWPEEKDIDEMTRPEMISAIFKCLDVDQAGYLNKVKLQHFAELTGFEGDSVAWGEEYVLLCSEVRCDSNIGLDQNSFEFLVAENGGCPVKDDELALILDTLQQRSIGVRNARSQSQPQKVPQKVPMKPPQTERDQLKQDAFHCLDKDGNGFLNCEESVVWGRATGFVGDDRMWQEEYIELCKEAGTFEGVNFEKFSEMVDDQGEQGVYLSDQELKRLVEEVSVKNEEVQIRNQLKRSVFDMLDANGDHFVGEKELWPFVKFTGYEGSYDEGAEDYIALCNDFDVACPSQGLCYKNFESFVDDTTSQGCYCTENELKAILQDLKEKQEKESKKGVRNGKGKETSQAKGKEKGKDKGKEKGDKGKELGKGKGKELGKGKGKEQGKGKEIKATGDQGDADPLAGADPWATPVAMRHKERLQQEKKAEEETWDKWRDAGKPGVGLDPAKPAVDGQKLLEATRAAIAKRKAEEAEKEAERAKEPVEEELEASPEKEERTRLSTEQARPPPPPVPIPHAEAEDDDFWAPSMQPKPDDGVFFTPTPQLKAVSMGVALAGVGGAIAQLAMGDRDAAQDLARHVGGAPCVAHAAAVASSALRSLLLGRTEEARTLLALDEVLLLPVEGDTTVLRGLERLALSVGSSGAPLLLRTLVAALSKVEDRHVEVRSAACSATEALVKGSDPFAFEALLPALAAALEPRRSPAMKLHSLKLLKLCWRRSKDGEAAVAEKLPELLPITTALLVDTSHEVRSVAAEAVDVLMSFSGNSDLTPHMEEIMSCAKGNRDVSKCVRDLAEVIFIQRVTAPALAVVLPVLSKGLKSRNARTQRQACLIAENMGRLVSAVADLRPFAPSLLPQLKRIAEEVADPDVRAVALRAHGALSEVALADRSGGVRKELRAILEMAVTEADVALAGAIGGGRDVAQTPCPGHVRDVVLDHVVLLCLGLGRTGSPWRNRLIPLLESALPGAASGYVDFKVLISSLRTVAERLVCTPSDMENHLLSSDSEEESLPILCDCTFTLACGAATLLTEARLQLRQGCVYGLVGGNDSGKSTLLRAIHDRRVSGFPSVSELRTSLVEHGVGERAPDCDLTPVEFLMADPAIGTLRQEDEVVSELKSMGFNEGARLSQPIKTLSGGWRMKMGLARAILQDADVVLLDEPTGHLDVTHIAWLVDYINHLQENREKMVTVIVVSHDAPFLDQVCTHIVYVNGSKLQMHRGNFSTFLARVPDAQLGSKSEEEQPLTAFVLPEPGPLEGVRSKGKRFLFLEDVVFTYPESSVPAVKGATVECSLRSRVAIMGPNGAGKSTVAGMVVGELAPVSGNAWRHPNLRMAYVAQHAFHHLEEHLELTAVEYILWRFQGNEDREALANRAEEDECLEPKAFRLEDDHLVLCDKEHPQALEPEVIVDRRQRGRLGYEYEMRWRSRTHTTWMSRGQVTSIGCLGMAKREDERQAAQRSLSSRPLTTPAVEAHLAGFGLSKEEACHRRLGALSSGQRARAVLGASTWLAPHLLVLDEPTNYLDQPALAALAAGLKVFGGGVLVISHTASFVDEVCSERWMMQGGVLQREGALIREDDEARPSAPIQNTAAKELKEKRKMKRLKELRKRFGQEVSDDEDEWWEDLVKKANAKNTGTKPS